MSTCNRLDLGTPGYRLVLPKNLPGHWTQVLSIRAVGVLSNAMRDSGVALREHSTCLQWKRACYLQCMHESTIWGPCMRERTNFWVQRWCDCEFIMCYISMLRFLVLNAQLFFMWSKEISSCNCKVLCPCKNSSWNACCPLMDSTNNSLQQYVTYWAKLSPCLCSAILVHHDLF